MKLQRLEVILSSAIFIFVLIIIHSDTVNYSTATYNYTYWGIAFAVYSAFIGFTQWIVPSYFRFYRIELGVTMTLVLFFSTWIGLTGSLWLSHQEKIIWSFLMKEASLGTSVFTFVSLFTYEGLKRLMRYLNQTKNPLKERILKEILIVLICTTFIFFLLVAINNLDLAALWICTIPYCYALFAINTYWLIPLQKQRVEHLTKYLILSTSLSFVLFIPFGLVYLSLSMMATPVYFVMWFGLTSITLLLSNYMFDRQKEQISQLLNLKIELGNTSAGLHFLRSQINPHFLFNVLNTLYATALQENAEKTSSGIQKLGDMMRFMLHENNQDRILMAREVEYLNNYVELQQLRTDSSKEINVQVHIEPIMSNVYIAPMLLIPFIENAFKHGISLQEKSWIYISMKESDNTLYFDLHNSIHRKNVADPEYKHSGIGLENVKQRLQMLYPERHELVVRETTQEHFVHLTIQL